MINYVITFHLDSFRAEVEGVETLGCEKDRPHTRPHILLVLQKTLTWRFHVSVECINKDEGNVMANLMPCTQKTSLERLT